MSKPFNPSGPGPGKSGVCDNCHRRLGDRNREVILEVFESHRKRGLPVPTNAELRVATGLTSTSTIFGHLRMLVKDGKLAQHRGKYYLTEAPSGQG